MLGMQVLKVFNVNFKMHNTTFKMRLHQSFCAKIYNTHSLKCKLQPRTDNRFLGHKRWPSLKEKQKHCRAE